MRLVIAEPVTISAGSFTAGRSKPAGAMSRVVSNTVSSRVFPSGGALSFNRSAVRTARRSLSAWPLVGLSSTATCSSSCASS